MKFQHTTPMSLGSGPLGLGQLDQFYTNNFPASAINQTWFQTGANVKNPYSCIVITLSGLTGGVPYCATIVNDNNVSATQRPRYCAPFRQMPEVTGTWQAVIPCNITPGKQVGGTIYFSANTTVTSIIVYGATQQTPFPMMRADGRAYPIGSQFAQANSTTAGNTSLIIPANGSTRIMLYTLSLTGGAVSAEASCQVQVTINGVTTALLFTYSGTVPGFPVSQMWPDGLLCDVGTTAILTLGAGTWSLACVAIATYDFLV